MSSITGRISIFGTAELDSAGQTIEFYNGFTLPVIATGDFDRPWMTVSWQNAGYEINWNTIGTLSDLSCGTTCLFDLGDAHLNVSQLTSINYVSDILFVYGDGIMSLTGRDPTPGKWSMSSQEGAYGAYTNWTALSWDPAPVPAPLVGAGVPGLLLLGVMLFGRMKKWWRIC